MEDLANYPEHLNNSAVDQNSQQFDTESRAAAEEETSINTSNESNVVQVNLRSRSIHASSSKQNVRGMHDPQNEHEHEHVHEHDHARETTAGVRSKVNTDYNNTAVGSSEVGHAKSIHTSTQHNDEPNALKRGAKQKRNANQAKSNTPVRKRVNVKLAFVDQKPVESNEDTLDIEVNSDDDDFSHDGEVGKTPHKTNTKTLGKVVKSPSKRKNDNTKNSPKKPRTTVASRLTAMTPPAPTTNYPALLYNDSLFQAETERADREREAARQMLLHTQREAELAKKRLVAEEDKKKILQLKKQAMKDNKRADLEKARYEKNVNKPKMSKRHGCTCPATEDSAHILPPCTYMQTQATSLSDPVTAMVEKEKARVKMLNPMRCSRLTYVKTDGSNNPNVPGQDNGLNAWLDANLNKQDFDREQLIEAMYAKCNSDHNKFMDIDDYPIMGPPKLDLNSDISENEAIQIASSLMNDENLSICRNTGMMKRMHSEPKKKTKSATVAKAPSLTAPAAFVDARESR